MCISNTIEKYVTWFMFNIKKGLHYEKKKDIVINLITFNVF